MIRVLDAEYLGDLRICLQFSDGASGIADFRGRLGGPIFRPLNDPEAFGRFQVTDHTLEWSNGADFAPEYLRELITETESTNHEIQQSGRQPD